MKAVIVIMLVAVLGALASAGVFMMRKSDDPTKPPDRHMARALALRVALSVALFLFVLLSWRMGWVRPSGIPIGS
jgi:hypothetical protein